MELVLGGREVLEELVKYEMDKFFPSFFQYI